MNQKQRSNMLSVLVALAVVAMLGGYYFYVEGSGSEPVSVVVVQDSQLVAYGGVVHVSGSVGGSSMGYKVVLVLQGANGVFKEFTGGIASDGSFAFDVRFNQDFNPIFFGTYDYNYVEARNLLDEPVGVSDSFSVTYVG